jgi:hypothetical protein
MSADRNLLFGILALQLDFVSKDALMVHERTCLPIRWYMPRSD